MSEADVAAAPAPRCAVHPERLAKAMPCERCGAFGCDACFGEEPDEHGVEPPVHEDLLCRVCRERTGRGTVPWENTLLPITSRLGRTLQRALGAPVSTFEAIGEGDLGRAASFSIVTTLIGYGPIFALLGLGVLVLAAFGLPGFSPIDGLGTVIAVFLALAAILPVFIVAFSLFADLYCAVVFHVAALLLGGKGSFEGSLRGALYTSAVRVVLAPLAIFMLIPLLGPLFNLAVRVGMLVWCAFALSGTARRVHGLDANAAALAGAAAPLSLVVVFIGLMALGFALGVASALGERL